MSIFGLKSRKNMVELLVLNAIVASGASNFHTYWEKWKTIKEI